MKNRLQKAIFLAILLLFSLSISSFAAQPDFPDAQGHWAQEYIEQLSRTNTIQGYPDGTIRPDRTITRAEFASLLASLMTKQRQETISLSSFHDLEQHWARQAVDSLVAQEILPHHQNFAPNAPITRQDMIQWTVSAIGGKELAMREQTNTSFQDDALLTPVQRGYFQVAVRYGLTEGYPDHTIRPQASSTRAEAFALLCRSRDAASQLAADQQPPEEEEKPSSSHSSRPRKNSQLEFHLPAAGHTDTLFSITATIKNVKDLQWQWTDQTTGEPVKEDMITGALTDSGGKITINQPGAYILTATGRDQNNKPLTQQHSITIHPVPRIALTLPTLGHVNDTIPVSLTLDQGADQTVIWSLKRQNQEITGKNQILAGLTNTGGSIRFEIPGVYTLSAAITDATGRIFSHNREITIYPLLDTNFYLPEHGYVGDSILVEASFPSDTTLTWTLFQDGQQIQGDQVEGKLNSHGGTLIFCQEGDYELVVSLTDATGKTFDQQAGKR